MWCCSYAVTGLLLSSYCLNGHFLWWSSSWTRTSYCSATSTPSHHLTAGQFLSLVFMVSAWLSLTFKALWPDEHHLDQYMLSSLSSHRLVYALILPTSRQTMPHFADSSRFGRWRMLYCGALGAAVWAGNDITCVLGMVAVCNKWLSSNNRYSIAPWDLKGLWCALSTWVLPQSVLLSSLVGCMEHKARCTIIMINYHLRSWVYMNKHLM